MNLVLYSSKNIYFQIGIASFTYSFVRESGPDIYTSVRYFADWIKEHVNA